MIKTAVRIFAFMTLLTGIAYPLLITAIAQLTMLHLANGSLIKQKEQIKGSLLIAQNNHDDRFFWARPSFIDYDPLKPSGGSNLGPTSKKLQELVLQRRQQYGQDAPADLLYASGSGLDPHISYAAAMFQVPRVAKARFLNELDLKNLIESQSEGIDILSKRYVNVLLLNLQLEAK